MTDSTDFAIRRDKVGLFIGRDGKTMARIEKLFDVEVELIDSASTQGEWVTIKGREENRRRAQEYVKSLCNPETAVSVSFPAAMRAELIGRNGANHQWLETSSGAVIAFREENTAEIRGSTVAVAAARRLIDEQVRDRSYVARAPSRPLNTSATTYASVDEWTRTVEHRGGASVAPGSSSRKIPPPDGIATDPSIILFAKKLGYSEEDAMRVIGRLGPNADRNSVLSALLKCAKGGELPMADSDVSAPAVKAVSGASQAGAESLRHVVVDGSNVAMRHGNNKVFSCRGIGLCVDYFIRRGHRKVTVFVPSWRKEKPSMENRIENQDVLYALERDGYLVFTPSRKVQGKRVVCYDDRFIVRLAAETSGVIVSNDTYRDLLEASPEWKEVIEKRLLMYTFAGDYFMPPDDPLGRRGPTLDDFLKVGVPVAVNVKVKAVDGAGAVAGQLEARGGGGGGWSDLKKVLCPYGKKCTYGSKCKYSHPEKQALPKEGPSYGTNIMTSSADVTPVFKIETPSADPSPLFPTFSSGNSTPLYKVTTSSADPSPIFTPEVTPQYLPPTTETTHTFDHSPRTVRGNAVVMRPFTPERDYEPRGHLVSRGSTEDQQDRFPAPGFTGYHPYEARQSFYQQGSPYMQQTPQPRHVQYPEQEPRGQMYRQYIARNPFSPPSAFSHVPSHSQGPAVQHYPHHYQAQLRHHQPDVGSLNRFSQFREVERDLGAVDQSQRLIRDATMVLPHLEMQFRAMMEKRPYISSLDELINVVLET
eukprot:m.20289 g.20289  ORF g.20289 m.20289 type:complete len:761 (+) comp27994_c0_seq3:2353-4635(+)